MNRVFPEKGPGFLKAALRQGGLALLPAGGGVQRLGLLPGVEELIEQTVTGRLPIRRLRLHGIAGLNGLTAPPGGETGNAQQNGGDDQQSKGREQQKSEALPLRSSVLLVHSLRFLSVSLIRNGRAVRQLLSLPQPRAGDKGG